MTDYCYKNEVSLMSEVGEEEELTLTNQSKLSHSLDSDEEWQSGSSSGDGLTVKYSNLGQPDESKGGSEREELSELVRLIREPKIRRFKMCKHFATKIKFIHCSFTKIKNVHAVFAPFFDKPPRQKSEAFAANEQVMRTLCKQLNYDLPSYIGELQSRRGYGNIYAATGEGLYNYNSIYFGKVPSSTEISQMEGRCLIQLLVRNIFKTAHGYGDRKLVIPEFYIGGVSKTEMFLNVMDNVFQSISFYYSKGCSVPLQEIIFCSKDQQSVKRWSALLEERYYLREEQMFRPNQKACLARPVRRVY